MRAGRGAGARSVNLILATAQQLFKLKRDKFYTPPGVLSDYFQFECLKFGAKQISTFCSYTIMFKINFNFDEHQHQSTSPGELHSYSILSPNFCLAQFFCKVRCNTVEQLINTDVHVNNSVLPCEN